jgi:hypothetical protein
MTHKGTPIAVAIASTLLIAACASNKPPELQGLSGSTQPNPSAMHEGELAGRTAMVYRAPNVDASQYTRFILDPVQIYQGADAKWSGASEQDRQQMAEFMQAEFYRVLHDRHQLAQKPGPGVARLDLILAGLDDNIPVVATVSRLAPAGLVLNMGKSVAGQPGSFTGSVVIAGTFIDSRTNATLLGFIQKRSPNAMNIGATLTSRDAQRAAITQAADAFGKRLDERRNKGT